MRFRLDGNLPPRPVERPTGAGYDARHVTDLGLASADDSAIFDRAAADGDVVVTADSDFSMRLAARRSAQPSSSFYDMWLSCHRRHTVTS
ncbi:MAG: DUF5615 family PIN-like protein [Mycobacteriales bacterium]